jgi:hypothetical protein
MKTAAFAIALLMSGAAFAQVDVAADSPAYEGDGAFTTVYETEGAAGGAYVDPTLTATELASADTAAVTTAAVTTAVLVQPSNSDPERDARGIAVISAAAVVPAGWNGTAAGAMGGPELDSVTGEAVAPDSYPACTATITDKCVQTYERGRH